MSGNKKIVNDKASDIDAKEKALRSDLEKHTCLGCLHCLDYRFIVKDTIEGNIKCTHLSEPNGENPSGKCSRYLATSHTHTGTTLQKPKMPVMKKKEAPTKALPEIERWRSKTKGRGKAAPRTSNDDHFKTLREDILHVGVMEAYNPPKEPLKRKRCPIRIVLNNGAKAQCKETFERDCDLVQHLRDAHNTTKAEIYKALLAPKKMYCPYTNDLTMITKRKCKEPIKNTSELYRHCALYHSKNKEQTDGILKGMGLKAEEVMECPIETQVTDIIVCAKQFETKRAARAHMMRVHKRTAEEVEKKMKRYKLKEA